MKNVKLIVGNIPNMAQPMEPFSIEVCTFLEELSRELLHDNVAKRLPDVVSLGYWCRKSNIYKIKEQYLDEATRLGRGIAFHITPSNVPVNFMFSYLFSLLAGNTNIVRMPSKETPEQECIIRILNGIIDKYPRVKENTAFVSYPSGDEATTIFSKMSDVRMIWGGDETIRKIRQEEAKPRCIDVAFADRYSIALLEGNAIVNAEEKELQLLARSFYNDTYYMDQNACSSPQLILWKNGSKIAKERFWNAIFEYASVRYNLQPIEVINKYTKMCEHIIDVDKISAVARKENLIVREIIDNISDMDITYLRGRCGHFFEYDMNSLDDIRCIINEKYQTLSYYGFDAKEIKKWVQSARLTGIDRIVPIGKTMDIGIVWDGFNLIESLSRIVYAE